MNRIETSYQAELLVLRVDVQSQAGRELGSLYSSRTTPTFIFFDAAGEELWRSIGSLDEEQISDFLGPPQ